MDRASPLSTRLTATGIDLYVTLPKQRPPRVGHRVNPTRDPVCDRPNRGRDVLPFLIVGEHLSRSGYIAGSSSTRESFHSGLATSGVTRWSTSSFPPSRSLAGHRVLSRPPGVAAARQHSRSRDWHTGAAASSAGLRALALLDQPRARSRRTVGSSRRSAARARPRAAPPPLPTRPPPPRPPPRHAVLGLCLSVSRHMRRRAPGLRGSTDGDQRRRRRSRHALPDGLCRRPRVRRA